MPKFEKVDKDDCPLLKGFKVNEMEMYIGNCPQSEQVYTTEVQVKPCAEFNGKKYEELPQVQDILECLAREDTRYTSTYNDALKYYREGVPNAARMVFAMYCYDLAGEYDHIPLRLRNLDFRYREIEQVAENLYSGMLKMLEEDN